MGRFNSSYHFSEGTEKVSTGDGSTEYWLLESQTFFRESVKEESRFICLTIKNVVYRIYIYIYICFSAKDYFTNTVIKIRELTPKNTDTWYIIINIECQAFVSVRQLLLFYLKILDYEKIQPIVARRFILL